MNANRTRGWLRNVATVAPWLALSLSGNAACTADAADADALVGGAAGGLAGGAAAAAGTGGAGDGGLGASSSGGGSAGAGGLGAGGSAAGGGTTPISCAGPGARFVTDVPHVDYGPGQSFGQDQMPDIVMGPPLGAGCCAGSTDVVSLGNGGEIVVAFAGNAIVDGPGADFVVFENPFEVGGDPDNVYAELATVAVSEDGQTWVEFPCAATSAPYGSCAGWHPVYLSGDDGPIDGASCGGDLFDLSDVGVSVARYVRITDRADIDGMTGVFDLDAVGIIHPFCP